MYISNFEITNYKSYRTSESVNFLPGFNLVTGKNNAGKTSLLEALTLNFLAIPHRSLTTIPVPGISPSASSSAVMTIVLSREEMLNMLQSSGRYVLLPVPAEGFLFADNARFNTTAQSAHRFIEWFLSNPDFKLSVRRLVGNSAEEQLTFLDAGFGLYTPRSTQDGRILMHFIPHADGTVSNVQIINADGDNFYIQLVRMVRAKIYRFFAERFHVSSCAFGANPVLASNALNLPEVLSVLQGNPQRFLCLNQLLHEILPQIQYVSVHPTSPSTVEIRAWPHDPMSQREDLALPLNQCGSGIGQVVAILYVVLTASHPQVILIDEPQSLLHPGAIRKLIEVLKGYPQHQYILATHSPTVVAAADPSTVVFAKLEGVETKLQTINTSQAQDLQLYLGDIGARLSDVFGADNIIWVEGQTEELAFPVILKQIAGRSLMGTAIIGIKQTGDLEGRDAKRVFELYHRLSGATALLPPALAFILDRECRSQTLREDLQRESKNRAHFLSRRMFENYLLNAEGISALANSIEGFRATPVTPDEVLALINDKRADMSYFCHGTTQLPVDWLVEIDGAAILKDIFTRLSETRVSFDKVRHSVALTKWVAENEPGQLQEIADLLVNILQN